MDVSGELIETPKPNCACTWPANTDPTALEHQNGCACDGAGTPPMPEATTSKSSSSTDTPGGEPAAYVLNGGEGGKEG